MDTQAPRPDLPNPLPRPAGELELLQQVWRQPKGWRAISEVNNGLVGPLFVATALLFFMLAGVLALIIRAQLAFPGLTLVDAGTYNQLFTMHGTVMMFLFAVPAVEAVAITLLPALLGSRELPFPRLGAYAFLIYLIGGLCFYCSIFFGIAPDGGWFMYPPLTGKAYSPGVNTDMYLLGIGFIEISAIAGAIELIVGILRCRGPGMTLGRMPIYAWAILVFAGMVIFAFPAVIIASTLLELERAFDWPFFLPERGGDPMLWQHLFWFFGHPEVYVIFLPAAGMVSMIVPAMAGARLVGHSMVVVALVGTGFISFGLWVHHMYTTGIPPLSLSFFAAAGFAVSIPSGLQVFAWIATFASARQRIQFTTPALFILGFLFIFTLGGLTGVMVSVTPFDWQAHDTYFIVAHLHYVLVGGMVFPLFSAIYYWAPAVGQQLSERLGKIAFWLMFLGTNLTFFPMHISGFMGMPRRIYTYPGGFGLELWNLLSSIGAAMFAAGVAVVLVDAVLHFRFGRQDKQENTWNAGTMEWIAGPNYGMRSLPLVQDRYPLWHDPDLKRQVEAGGHYLPFAATGRRESLICSPAEATPQYVAFVAGPGWSHVVAAAGTAAFFLALAGSFVIPAAAAGVVALVAFITWVWNGTDVEPGTPERVDIGGGIVLPTHATGPITTSWWAMVCTMLVSGTAYACLIGTYLFLWLVNGDGMWPPPGQGLPVVEWGLAAFALYGAAALSLVVASATLGDGRGWTHRIALLAGLALLAAGFAADGWALWQGPIRPTLHAYGASAWGLFVWQATHVAIALLMGGYTLARSLAGKLGGQRRLSIDNTRLFWLYTAGQGAVGLVLLHGFPRLLP
ncbi:cytochrome ubiquinol oxidase subunit I [Roseomonas frigidaquae]|uniref:Cytochrome ubiquinol oxidase subunit I n=1 Tax=Falsiroseomonas frigidaquae TaxID=487318 RepID=A0ABX1EZ82_9PROT|nr:cbb3-type cytochrome c oxidase subunit I [Falsiroseomonas frigidaquae]NKE45401.1 cytochrome ubiquinol oxidase subunit I [Falsiroseomonas frigidaquae]